MRDNPICVYSDHYKDSVVVYGEVRASLKGVKDQLSDILAVPVQRIRLWRTGIQRFGNELSDDDIIERDIFLSTVRIGGLWMELHDP
jgi:hypothetical protein